MTERPDENHEDEVEQWSPPSMTNPQCKVCNSPDRRAIEVALVQGRGQDTIARVYTRNGQQFSRQNIHTHYHRHMQVVDRATVERARLHARNAMLDVESAKAISRGNEELRDLLREGARRAAQSEALRWTAKDVIAFLERDEQMEQERSGMQVDLLMREVQAFSAAVRMVLLQPLWDDLMENYKRQQVDAKLDESDFFYVDNMDDPASEAETPEV